MMSTLDLVKDRRLKDTGIDNILPWMVSNLNLIDDVANLIIEYSDIFNFSPIKFDTDFDDATDESVSSAAYLYTNLLAYFKIIKFDFNTTDVKFNRMINNSDCVQKKENNLKFLKQAKYLLKKFKIDEYILPTDDHHLKVLMWHFVELINVPIYICNCIREGGYRRDRTLKSYLFTPKDCNNYIHAYIRFDGNIAEEEGDDQWAEMSFGILTANDWIFPVIPLPDQNILPTDINKEKLTLKDHEFDSEYGEVAFSIHLRSECPFYENFIHNPKAVKKMQEYIESKIKYIMESRIKLDKKEEFIKSLKKQIQI